MTAPLLTADYRADRRSDGEPDRRLRLTLYPGDTAVLWGAPGRCDRHFRILSGLQRPVEGEVQLAGVNPMALPPREAAALRRTILGAVPRGGGFLPEVPMMEQVTLPLRLSGLTGAEIEDRLCRFTGEDLPLHLLYNRPGDCHPARQLYAALLRAVLPEPKLLLLHDWPETLPDRETARLWDAVEAMRPPDSALLIFSSSPRTAQENRTVTVPI